MGHYLLVLQHQMSFSSLLWCSCWRRSSRFLGKLLHRRLDGFPKELETSQKEVTIDLLHYLIKRIHQRRDIISALNIKNIMTTIGLVTV